MLEPYLRSVNEVAPAARIQHIGLLSMALDSGIQAGMTNNGIDRYGARAPRRLLGRSGGAWRAISMSHFTHARALQQRPAALEHRAVRDDAGETVKE